MGKTKCKKKEKYFPKPEHPFQCKKCGLTAKKEKKLCKPIKMKLAGERKSYLFKD